MQTSTHFTWYITSSLVPALALILFVGCQSAKEPSRSSAPALEAIASAPAQSQPANPALAPAGEPKPAPKVIRIRAGDTTPLTDSSGNVWLPAQGFADGETTVRAGDLSIANTKDPALYRSERYMMTAFSQPLPNGKYTVKLHFAETYEEIKGPGQRVFSFNVQGREFKDFDVFAKAGGAQRAYIESVNVDVTNGKLDITFASNIQSPEINGIEIIPGT
jgi:hypothetical protein